ncbi:MAG: FtsW/RodA/SpoVE family cell cycle protein, partial [Thioalkalispiraceae bacterium]
MPGFTRSEFTDTTRIHAGRRVLRNFHVDLPLLLGLLLLVAVGLMVLYSASEQDSELVIKQLIRLGIAFAVMFVVAQISPDTLRYWSPWLFGVGLIMLVAVLFLGDVGKGAQRWLNVGFFSFQPSELMKLALPMLLAWYLSEVNLPPRFKHILIALLIMIVPIYLVAKQPDLGTSLLLGCSALFVLFLAGIRWFYIIMSVLLLIPVSLLLWFYGMHDYQRNRV